MYTVDTLTATRVFKTKLQQKTWTCPQGSDDMCSSEGKHAHETAGK